MSTRARTETSHERDSWCLISRANGIVPCAICKAWKPGVSISVEKFDNSKIDVSVCHDCRPICWLLLYGHLQCAECDGTGDAGG